MKRSKLFLNVLAFSLAIFIVFGIYKSIDTNNITSFDYAICELVPYKNQDDIVRHNAKFRYLVNGKEFFYVIDPMAYRYNVIGEKYILKYDTLSPEKCQIISHKPLFLKHEKKIETTGVITRVYLANNAIFRKKNRIYGVEYEYDLNGYKFKRSQDISPEFGKKYLKLLKENKTCCRVLIWTNNPKRAILYIDETKIP